MFSLFADDIKLVVNIWDFFFAALMAFTVAFLAFLISFHMFLEKFKDVFSDAAKEYKKKYKFHGHSYDLKFKDAADEMDFNEHVRKVSEAWEKANKALRGN